MKTTAPRRAAMHAAGLAALSLAFLAGGCSASQAERDRAERTIQIARQAIQDSNASNHASAARGFAELWAQACSSEGPSSESSGTYVLAQHPELRRSFRSDEGRPIARELLSRLAAKTATSDADRRLSAGVARLAAILNEPGIVAEVVEARSRAGLGMSPVRPFLGLLVSSGRTDLAAKVEPSAARRAAEDAGEAVATAGLVVITAPVSVPLAIISASGPTDFPVNNPDWTDPVRREDW
jgi:hypothetical protein